MQLSDVAVRYAATLTHYYLQELQHTPSALDLTYLFMLGELIYVQTFSPVL